MDADAREPLRAILARLSLDTEGFGNARGVRNLFERAVSAQADRLAAQAQVTRETLMLLTAGTCAPPRGRLEADYIPAHALWTCAVFRHERLTNVYLMRIMRWTNIVPLPSLMRRKVRS